MSKIEILLENLGILEQVDQLKKANIEKVTVNRDNEYLIYLRALTVLPFTEFVLLNNNRSKFPYPLDFKYKYDNIEMSEEEFKAYLKYILNKEKEGNLDLNYLNPEYFSYNDVININFPHESEYLQFKSLATEIEDIFKKVGINKKVVIGYQVKEDRDEPLEVKEIDIEIPKEKPKSAYKNNYNNRKYSIIETKIADINNYTNESNLIIKGYIFKTDIRDTRNNGQILTLFVTDYTDSIKIKLFANEKSKKEEFNLLSKGKTWIKVRGSTKYDEFEKERILEAKEIETIKKPKMRQDSYDQKRVELHLHTKMSAMDGVNNIDEFVKRAKEWGHRAIAITDHENIQAFPEAQEAAKNNDIKMIYGVELNMVDPNVEIVFNEKDISIEHATYVSFDLETTGFSVVHDKITEFGAVKIINGQVVDRMQTFINPHQNISSKITKLTNITNEMVADAPDIEAVLPKILDFFGDAILVAHNAKFDIGFLNENLERQGLPAISNPVIDSLALARAIMKPMKSYRLGKVCRAYHVDYNEDGAHRADYDAQVLGDVFTIMIHQVMQGRIYGQEVNDEGYYNLLELNKLISKDSYKLVYPYHVTALAINKTGLKNIFKIVSESNTLYLHESPRIPKQRLEFYHEGVIYGTSCYKSDVFEAAMNASDKHLEELMTFYDYVEIQPLADYYHLIYSNQIANEKDLIDSLKRIIKIANKLNKIIVATGDVHFLDPKDKIYRDVFVINPTIGIGHRPHPLRNREDPNNLDNYPNQYFRTTDEMMDCYPYLTEEEKIEYIITNPNKIADMVDEVKPVHSKLYPPTIPDADEKLTEICYKNAHKMYGDKLPSIVEKRLKKELDNIIKHGFGVIYYIAHLLVKKSNDDGYLVGSRGSVGSSFVATMAGISEVNPLPPHYHCPQCGHSEFIEDDVIANGFDLPDKNCLHCGHKMIGDGHNIPFETFLGFNADKVPDIDLNFSGEYQAKAHAFTREMLGSDNVFRAGTISTVAAKTAFGYAKGFFELLGKENDVRGAELERIAAGCEGVKRTTGQHPGGIIAIPRDMDVYDFTPVQYPADDIQATWKTTHFDFHKIHDNVLKFDILGHVDPTVIRALQDITHVDPHAIPTNDEKVISLFTSSKALGIDLSYIGCNVGTLGLPEFGTNFVRRMLEKTKPKSFNDLVVISGLSHGTDVYTNNAELLIESGTCTLKEVIGCRDDIMTYLITKGLPNKDAFDIMECVRKGNASKVFPTKKYEELMKEHNVPQWYIDSCKKIKYMFPKAHAAAYVLSAIRVAWWKVYYPREYYTVYLTTRCDFYEIDTMIKGKDNVLSRRNEIRKMRDERKASNKEIGLIDVFDITLEMLERGYHISPINLELSEATKFILDPNDPKGIIPPFSAIDSLGDSVAQTVIDARNKQRFISKEDVIKRTKLNNSHINILSKMGVFSNLQEENQLSFF